MKELKKKHSRDILKSLSTGAVIGIIWFGLGKWRYTNFVEHPLIKINYKALSDNFNQTWDTIYLSKQGTSWTNRDKEIILRRNL